ncbi:hypothetical protein AK812_SmicGene16038 [Symbiodinium microadriaticum]|uniref:Uncharacterized protein n=1 Tax=Symbiodinium microadriaticum TaxID=2951 RepID=A0A1Q9E1E3_SYMMI|nr:hypothetical protein AK812_SmicGene16038 [Symbiodinium microadriaticum]
MTPLITTHVVGVAKKVANNQIDITELPVKKWTQAEGDNARGKIDDMKEFHTENTVALSRFMATGKIAFSSLGLQHSPKFGLLANRFYFVAYLNMRIVSATATIATIAAITTTTGIIIIIIILFLFLISIAIAITVYMLIIIIIIIISHLRQ